MLDLGLKQEITNVIVNNLNIKFADVFKVERVVDLIIYRIEDYLDEIEEKYKERS